MDEFIVVQSSWFCTISREINWPRQYEQLRTSIGAKKQHFGANKLHWGLIWAIDSMVNLTAFCSFFTPALANLNQAKILATFSGHEKNAKTNTSFLFGSEKSPLILCDTLDLDTARRNDCLSLHTLFRHSRGSQLTFMTHLEKMINFRHAQGIPTGLLYVRKFGEILADFPAVFFHISPWYLSAE